MMKNEFESLRMPGTPDTGCDSREYIMLQIYSDNNNMVTIYIGKHDTLYTVGYNYTPLVGAAKKVFPTCQNGLFQSADDATLYMLGALRAVSFRMSPEAASAINKKIFELRQFTLF